MTDPTGESRACPKCGAERDPVSDKYPKDVTFYLCGRCVIGGKPSEYHPVQCRIAELTRQLAERDELLREVLPILEGMQEISVSCNCQECKLHRAITAALTPPAKSAEKGDA